MEFQAAHECDDHTFIDKQMLNIFLVQLNYQCFGHA